MFLTLALCLALVPTTAVAADTPVRIVPTDLQADGVINYDGYGFLVTDGGYTDDFTAYNPAQFALIDREGKLVFPYREDPVGGSYLAWDAAPNFSDGIISFTLRSCYYTGGTPKYYHLDGSSAFTLESTTEEYIKDGIHYQDFTNWTGYPVRDGYTVVIKNFDSYWSIPGFMGGCMESRKETRIVDKTGAVTCVLPEEYNEVLQSGASSFITKKALGWCGEGLLAFYERTQHEDGSITTEPLGYMDPTGKTVIGLKGQGYTGAWPFYGGLAGVVNQDGKVGFIDKTGALVIPCAYDDSHAIFCDGLCPVQKDGKWGYIDKTGATVIPFEYDEAYGAGSGLAAVIRDGKCGLVDYNNHVVVPLEYDDISDYKGGAAYGIKNRQVYLITDYDPNASDSSDRPSNFPAVEDIPATGAAVARTQTVRLDGKEVTFQCYAVKDAAGNETNYVKVRDLALALNGTESQFNVNWDGKISITPNTPYQAVGGEGFTPYSGNQPYRAVSGTPVSFNGGTVNLTSFSITCQGGGYTYYKLRDLGQLLDFNVKWDGGVIIETDKPYTGQ